MPHWAATKAFSMHRARQANVTWLIINALTKHAPESRICGQRLPCAKKAPKIKPKMPKKVAGDARLRKPCHARLRQGEKAGNAVTVSSRHGGRAAPGVAFGLTGAASSFAGACPAPTEAGALARLSLFIAIPLLNGKKALLLLTATAASGNAPSLSNIHKLFY